MTQQLTFPHPDLLQIPYATMATVNPDGRPQVTEVAFLYDTDGLLKVSLNDTRQKTRNLTRDPRVTFFLIDPQTPLRTMEIRAVAELLPDPAFAFAARVGAKYSMDFREHDGPSDTRSIVILRPEKINVADLRPSNTSSDAR